MNVLPSTGFFTEGDYPSPLSTYFGLKEVLSLLLVEPRPLADILACTVHNDIQPRHRTHSVRTGVEILYDWLVEFCVVDSVCARGLVFLDGEVLAFVDSHARNSLNGGLTDLGPELLDELIDFVGEHLVVERLHALAANFQVVTA